MNIKECRDLALQLINQYSITGTPIGQAYNNQSDILLKVNPLIDDAQKYIATSAKKIFAQFPISQVAGVRPATIFGSSNVYQMPIDFYQLVGRGIPYYDQSSKDQTFILSRDYKWRGRDLLCIESEITGEFIVDYFRYPVKITPASLDTVELDNVIEAQQCVPFYVAAHLVQMSNPSLAAILTNEFETKMSRIVDPVQTEFTEVENKYDFYS